MAASVQQAQGAVQLNDKEKASIGEAVKEAQKLLESNDSKAKAVQDQLVLVTGIVKNAQSRAIGLLGTHSWKGRFLAESSKIGETAFVHQGDPGVGSKGAVIYATLDKMYPGLGWLVAFERLDNSDEVHKVYVEAGNSSKFAKVDWKEIEAKLDASGDISRYWDSETGAAAVAQITNYGGKLALVGATFDRFDK